MGLFIQEKFKIDFQDGNLQVTLRILTKFQVEWPFGSGEAAKNRFSRWLPWQPSWISDQNNFKGFFYLPVTPMHPTKFRVIWPFGSGEEAKNRFSRWLPWLPSWISDYNNFNFYKSPQSFLPRLKSIGLSVQEKKWKTDFQDGDHLGFPIGTIFIFFVLQVTPMLPTKFQVNCPFSSREKENKSSASGGIIRP